MGQQIPPQQRERTSLNKRNRRKIQRTKRSHTHTLATYGMPQCLVCALQPYSKIMIETYTTSTPGRLKVKATEAEITNHILDYLSILATALLVQWRVLLAKKMKQNLLVKQKGACPVFCLSSEVSLTISSVTFASSLVRAPLLSTSASVCSCRSLLSCANGFQLCSLGLVSVHIPRIFPLGRPPFFPFLFLYILPRYSLALFTFCR